jgi:hypothetical protein
VENHTLHTEQQQISDQREQDREDQVGHDLRVVVVVVQSFEDVLPESTGPDEATDDHQLDRGDCRKP